MVDSEQDLNFFDHRVGSLVVGSYEAGWAGTLIRYRGCFEKHRDLVGNVGRVVVAALRTLETLVDLGVQQTIAAGFVAVQTLGNFAQNSAVVVTGLIQSLDLRY